MCSVEYDEDIPLRLPNTQLPPTLSDASKQSKGMPRSASAFAAVIPEEPAPMMHARGRAPPNRAAIARRALHWSPILGRFAHNDLA